MQHLLQVMAELAIHQFRISGGFISQNCDLTVCASLFYRNAFLAHKLPVDLFGNKLRESRPIPILSMRTGRSTTKACIMIHVSSIITAMIISFLAAKSPSSFGPQECWMEGAQELHLRGFMGERMSACIAKQDLSSLKRVVVSSTGGFVSIGIDIAERLASYHPHVIIRDLCLSSCANYLIPIASRLTVEPYSMIGLHGGAIKMLETLKRSGRSPPSSLKEDAAREQAFLLRHGVRPDWFLPTAFVESRKKKITNPLDFNLFFHDSQILAASPEFVRSCLPQIEIESFWYLFDHIQELKTAKGRSGIFHRFVKRLRPLSSEKLRCRPDSNATR